jgi:hypothetical protein
VIRVPVTAIRKWTRSLRSLRQPSEY